MIERKIINQAKSFKDLDGVITIPSIPESETRRFDPDPIKKTGILFSSANFKIDDKSFLS